MSEKYSHIDDLFREKLKDLEVNPPDFVWEKVREKIPKTKTKGPWNRPGTGGIVGTAVILILTGIFSFSLINGPSDKIAASAEETGQNTIFTDYNPDGEIASLSRGVQQPVEPAETVVPLNNEEGEKIKETKKTEQKPPRRVKAANPSKNAGLLLQPSTTGTIPEKRMGQNTLLVRPKQAYTVTAGTNPLKSPPVLETGDDNAVVRVPGAETDPMLRMNEPTANSKKGPPSDFSLQNKWSLGLFYTPEMIVYPSDDQMKNYSRSVDLLVSYSRGNYFLQSGFGLAWNKDQGNTEINYNQYLGSYEDVYHVTFDSTENGIIPIYHTETVDVYDSVTHVTISPTKRTFTYLQIPILIGYGETYRRFGWSLKFGPSVSILLDEDLPGKDNAMMQARIIGIENELPGRIHTNWQFIFSAGLSYKLGNTIDLNVEPLFRYYIRSAYENNTLNTRHPWSAGLRTGITIRF